MRKKIFLITFSLLPFLCFSQNRYTLSGYIKDAQNGETLIGATITVKGQTKGISSNLYGFYSITLTKRKYELICSYVGYQTTVTEVEMDKDRQVNFELFTKTSLSQEVIVSSTKR